MDISALSCCCARFTHFQLAFVYVTGPAMHAIARATFFYFVHSTTFPMCTHIILIVCFFFCRFVCFTTNQKNCKLQHFAAQFTRETDRTMRRRVDEEEERRVEKAKTAGSEMNKKKTKETQNLYENEIVSRHFFISFTSFNTSTACFIAKWVNKLAITSRMTVVVVTAAMIGWRAGAKQKTKKKSRLDNWVQFMNKKMLLRLQWVGPIAQLTLIVMRQIMSHECIICWHSDVGGDV